MNVLGLHVVLHVAVTLDGATTGFDPDLATFYRLAATWTEDLTLTGADTILAQEQALAATPGPGPAEDGPVLGVVDGRRRVACWDALRNAGYWREVVALRTTDLRPAPSDGGVEEILAGTGRVDLADALAKLRAAHGVRTVRVDSGGALAGAMLDAGLVDELSLLIHPVVLPAGTSTRWWGTVSRPHRWTLRAAETVDQLTWLRFDRAEGPSAGSSGPGTSFG